MIIERASNHSIDEGLSAVTLALGKVAAALCSTANALSSFSLISDRSTTMSIKSKHVLARSTRATWSGASMLDYGSMRAIDTIDNIMTSLANLSQKNAM
jgi:hypothetical protein